MRERFYFLNLINKLITIKIKGADAQSETQITANAVMKGLTVKPAATPTISNKLMADQIAAKLNAKLGHVPLDRDENSSVRQVRLKVSLILLIN